ncbi:MAG: hypothetical protein ABI045_03985 [Flavobacteriales bacterium]
MAAITEVISTAGMGVRSPIIGIGHEARRHRYTVVIGRISLKWGKGMTIHTLLGLLILGMIGNIMTLIDIPTYR